MSWSVVKTVILIPRWERLNAILNERSLYSYVLPFLKSLDRRYRSEIINNVLENYKRNYGAVVDINNQQKEYVLKRDVLVGSVYHSYDLCALALDTKYKTEELPTFGLDTFESTGYIRITYSIKKVGPDVI